MVPVSPSTVTSIERGRSRGQERSRDHRLSPPRSDAMDHLPTRSLPRASLDPSPSSTCHVAFVDATFATSVEDDHRTSIDSSAASVSFSGTCEVCVCSGFIRAPSHNDDVRSRSTSATKVAPLRSTETPSELRVGKEEDGGRGKQRGHDVGGSVSCPRRRRTRKWRQPPGIRHTKRYIESQLAREQQK